VDGTTPVVGALVAEEIVVATGFVDAGATVVDGVTADNCVDAGVLVALSPQPATAATIHTMRTTRDFMQAERKPYPITLPEEAW
jgi:hypothetical protein